MSNDLPVYILDSFALLALLDGEPCANRVEALLDASQQGRVHLYLPLINLGEILYITERERGLVPAQKTLATLEQLPLLILPATRERVLAAAHLKANFPIAYADAFVAAAAREFAATLVTGDPEFRAVETIIPVEWLTA